MSDDRTGWKKTKRERGASGNEDARVPAACSVLGWEAEEPKQCSGRGLIELLALKLALEGQEAAGSAPRPGPLRLLCCTVGKR